VIVDDLPQPLLLTAVPPPELLLAPELELPLAPESPVEAAPLLEPESIEMPELEVEPPPEVPELDPLPLLGLPELDALPEFDALPEEEIAASLSGELSVVELLPHALAIAARHARHAVSAEWRRALLVTLSAFIWVPAGEKFRKIAGSSYLREIGSGPSRSGIRRRDPSPREGLHPAARSRFIEDFPAESETRALELRLGRRRNLFSAHTRPRRCWPERPRPSRWRRNPPS
jgi:hypothetical protein